MRISYSVLGYVILGLAIIALGYTIFSMVADGAFGQSENNGAKISPGITPNPSQNNQNQITGKESTPFATVSTGTTETGDVAIDLVPYPVKEGKLRVDLAANTHSVDLSKFDLRAITKLSYNGKTIAPTEAPSLQGHHLSGTLVFPVDDRGDITPFTITITGIPLVNERVFTWK
ncbi:hypothetical protein HYW21_02540 [Candidatus Woesearchaeota archaeon]|nr:hypothetical protein [Candidatus Woesearchaeota archaeon]